MLESIRERSQGPIAKIILILIILSFAIAGVGNYLGGSTDTTVAEVNGITITNSELEQAYQNERARLEQQMGEMFNTLAANPVYLQNIKNNVLEQLISKALLDQSIQKLGLTISDAQINKTITEMENFQIDGKFENERFKAILRQIGLNVAQFKQMIATDMVRNQFLTAVNGSGFVLESEASELAKLSAQTRDIRFKQFETSAFMEQVTVSEAEINGHYDANPDNFMAPEMVSVEYIELDAKAMANEQQVSNEEVAEYYQANLARFQTKEQRLAAHILIDDTSEKGEALANEVVDLLNAGTDFATLAKDYSKDSLSAENGGQLDWFERGVMGDQFDDALFALEKGAVSSIIKTDFGYQIIKALDIKPSQTSPLEAVQAEIEESIKQDKAVEGFYALQSRLADLSFEIPDSLSEVAKLLELEVKTTASFARAMAPEAVKAPVVLNAIFSDDVLLNGYNSEVIELDTNHVMVVRMKEHTVAGIKPIEAVSAQIEAQLKREKALELAQAEAVKIQDSILAGDSVELESVAATARYNPSVDGQLLTEAFKQPVNAAQTVQTAMGYAVVVVDAINDVEAPAQAEVESIKQGLQGQLLNEQFAALLEQLKANAEINYTAQPAN